MPKVEGSERLALERPVVWRLLNDPETLAASIPGCDGFERADDGEHRYRTAIKVAVGPVTGVYEGTVEYLDVAEPERCTIVVAGKGDKGTIEGRGEITLAAADGATEVGYVGDFKLTGPVAGVGTADGPRGEPEDDRRDAAQPRAPRRAGHAGGTEQTQERPAAEASAGEPAPDDADRRARRRRRRAVSPRLGAPAGRVRRRVRARAGDREAHAMTRTDFIDARSSFRASEKADT